MKLFILILLLLVDHSLNRRLKNWVDLGKLKFMNLLNATNANFLFFKPNKKNLNSLISKPLFAFQVIVLIWDVVIMNSIAIAILIIGGKRKILCFCLKKSSPHKYLQLSNIYFKINFNDIFNLFHRWVPYNERGYKGEVTAHR